MEIKKIKVSKGVVTKEIDARQEKDYAKNGWVVVKEVANTNPFANTITSNYFRK